MRWRAGKINIFIVTMGCAKNSVDSEHMAGYLTTAGHRVVDSLDQAEAAIVNTCGFIQPAVEENIETILELVKQKESGQIRLLIVTGCLTQRYQDDLAVEFPEVDGFVGTGEYQRIGAIFAEAAAGGQPRSYLVANEYEQHLPRFRSEGGPSAYLKVAEGCPRRCSYCIIPSIRGPLHSRAVQDIVREACQLVDQGVKELVLVAQDTTAYGLDLGGRSLLPKLLDQLGEIPKLHRVRFLYAYPDLITDELLTVMRDQAKVCPYLDLPLQHVSTQILKSMGRKGDAGEYRRLIQKIRSYLPEVALHSTFIVGYPGETEEEFAELLKFIDEIKFNQLAAFVFYPEEGTRAAKLSNQVPVEIAQERLRRLTDLQEIVSMERNQKRVGKYAVILVESVQPKTRSFTGRSWLEAPEIDALFSCTALPGQNLPQIGDFVQVKIGSADSQEITGVLVQNCEV